MTAYYGSDIICDVTFYEKTLHMGLMHKSYTMCVLNSIVCHIQLCVLVM